MGLGTLGGGVASAKWFISQGAKVTITDLRSKTELQEPVRELHNFIKSVLHSKGAMLPHSTSNALEFVLGKHREKDFKGSDIIVVNPAVPRESKYLVIARKTGKKIVNDARIFFDTVPNPIVAVTGTRGKTTTTNWIAHFLKAKYPKAMHGGNSSKTALLLLADKLTDKKTPAVVELSSWQLELLDKTSRGPDVAVITNIFPDHLNRYRNVRDYASAKANIFSKQTAAQKLILNFDNPWTKFFLSKKSKSEIYFISLKGLPAGHNGLCSFPVILNQHRAIKNLEGEEILPRRGRISMTRSGTKEVLCYSIAPEREIAFVLNGKKQKVFSADMVGRIEMLGEHNMYNFLASALAVRLMGVSWAAIEKRVSTLPQIALREEIILRRKNIIVVNDSAGTSPDATIAAIRRFAKQGSVVLITGGTDKNLEFKPLAREIKKTLKPEQVFFLNGSATKKLIKELRALKYFSKTGPKIFEGLPEIIKGIRNKVSGIGEGKTVVLFSPGAASFEKFKNEFDRGEKFNITIKETFEVSDV